MDSNSRLLRNAIMVSVCVIAMILLAVVMGNWNDIKARYGGLLGVGSKSDGTEDTQARQEDIPPNGSKQVGSNLSGFLSDDTFFDKDPLKESRISVSYGKTASLIMSSVERDLKIHIVDILGKNIEGVEFSVSIEGAGGAGEIDQYRDSDRDGIIYVKPIRAGTCKVTLNPQPGFKTPEEPSVITIRQKIEYVAINAIDLIILTEDEIDASKEDTSNKTADADRDATERTEALRNRIGSRVGIDVSKWNKEIDWDKVKEAGVEFAIIRLGYRGYTSGSLIEDPYFQANMKGAADAGIPIGVYFFSQALTLMEAVEEASMVIELCKNYRLLYPVFLDSESTGGNGRADDLSAELRTELSKAFMETIKSAGYKVGIYGARNWFGKHLEMEKLEDYIIWLAEYREVPLYQGYYQMWQHSSRGRIDGINGNVDLNISYLN